MGEDPKPRLDYDRTATTVNVRGFRILLLLLVINTVMLGWFIVGPQTSRFVQQQWSQWRHKREMRKAAALAVAAQQQCLAHTFPPDLVILEEDPEIAKRLLSESSQYAPVTMENNHRQPDWVPPVMLTRHPAAWNALISAPNFPGVSRGSGQAVVFLHERTSPGGNRRLVVVQLMCQQHFGSDQDGAVRITTPIVLYANALAPGTVDEPPERKEDGSLLVRVPEAEETRFITKSDEYGRVVRGPIMRIFAGQVDPDDVSHFTIPYQLGQRRGVIDGWLRDEEIMLKPRGGRLTMISGNPTWELETATTATQPASAAP